MTPKGRRIEFDGEVIYIAGPNGERVDLFMTLGKTPEERDLARRIGKILTEAVGGNPHAIPIRWRS
jgi:hypothetical protein